MLPGIEILDLIEEKEDLLVFHFRIEGIIGICNDPRLSMPEFDEPVIGEVNEADCLSADSL